MPQDNNLLTSDVIAKEALRLLKNELVAARLVYRQYENTFAKVGDTIRLKLPFRVKAADGRVLVKQPMADQTVPFSIDYQNHVGLEYTVRDLTLSITEFSSRYLSSAMSQLANKVDHRILMTLKKAYHSSGTPGTRPGAYIDFANAAARMTTYGVPQDGMRRQILPPFVCAELSDNVTKLLQNNMVKDAWMNGYQGAVAKLQTFESNNLPTHTVGNYGGTPLVAGTIANGSSVTTDGWTPSVTGLLKEGDVITFAGVFGINPQNYTSTGLLKEFVVTADVDSTAGGLATIPIYPALNDGTATATNADGATVSLAAFQNVTALPADNAPITVMGTANTIYEQSYLFHKEAIALAMVDLELPQTANVKSRVNDPDSGLSLTMTGAYDINEHTEIHRIDVVYGTDLINGELAQRLWGANLGVAA